MNKEHLSSFKNLTMSLRELKKIYFFKVKPCQLLIFTRNGQILNVGEILFSCLNLRLHFMVEDFVQKIRLMCLIEWQVGLALMIFFFKATQ